MNPTTTARTADPLVARWALAGVAFAVAAFMLTFYVQLLNDSVARGMQSRYSQSIAGTSALSSAIPSAVPSAVVEAATNAGVRLVSTSR